MLSRFLIVGSLALTGCSSRFGKLPSQEESEKFKSSAHYDPKKEIFVNRRPDIMEATNKRVRSFSGIWKILFGGSSDAKPDFELPGVAPDFAKFQEASEDIKLIWFGHSSLLLNLGGTHVLLDPVLSESTGPYGFMMRRFRKTVALPESLPRIDVVVLSHDHYDHLDTDTIRYFHDKETRFVVPLGVGAHLKQWGIAGSRITELDWWQTTEFGKLKFTAAPAQHFSGRALTGHNKSLWASWVIEERGRRIYFSGDSGYDIHFKEIGDKLGPFDLAFIESGQYNALWPESHLLPEDSIKAYRDLRGRRYFPIHWGMFSLSSHSWFEPIERISKLATDHSIPLVTPVLGEIVVLNSAYTSAAWWKPYLN